VSIKSQKNKFNLKNTYQKLNKTQFFKNIVLSTRKLERNSILRKNKTGLSCSKKGIPCHNNTKRAIALYHGVAKNKPFLLILKLMSRT